MKNSFIYLLMLFVAANIFAQSTADNHPEWVYKMRIVSINQPWQGKEVDLPALKETLQELKKAGVNTIMAHGGSFQFLDNLPNDKPQWKRQVNYDSALPFSNAVKEAGFKLFHHTTSTFVPIEAMAIPEYRSWVSEDIRSGTPSLRKANTAYSNACFMDMNHPGFRKKLFDRMSEFAYKCNVDAWMTDEVEWLANIYACGNEEGSGKLYQERFNKSFPQGTFDPLLPKWREYISFRYDSGGEFYAALNDALKKVKPEIYLSGCLAGISKYHRRIWAMGSESWLRGLTLGFFEMEEGFHPRRKPAGYLSTTYWPTYYRELALYNANGEINGWPCSYSLGYPSRWQIDDSEQFYLWALTLSLGHRYWMRDYQAETKWFKWEETHEEDLIKPLLCNDIGVFFPEFARDFAVNPTVPYQNWSGFSEALAWHNLPADQLIRAHFTSLEHLQRFKMIFLPSAGFVSQEMCNTLEAFVKNGGILIASGDCFVQAPFAAERTQPDALLALLGVAETAGWSENAVSFQHNGADYSYPDGMLLTTPSANAQVLATADAAKPAIIYHKSGQGETYFFTGNWGISMYNVPQQKTTTYQQSFEVAARQNLANLVNHKLDNRLRTEVKNLPAKVLFNAYDTDGDFDGVYKRTLHILDSYDGYEPGENFPETNMPCRFKEFYQRNDNQEIDFILRDIKSVASVKLISPDFIGEKSFTARFEQEKNAFVISIPAKAFGRYSVLVVEKQ